MEIVATYFLDRYRINQEDLSNGYLFLLELK